MTGQADRSPSPFAIGSVLGRRRFLVGAGTVGIGAVLAACGSDSDGGAASGSPTTDGAPTTNAGSEPASTAGAAGGADVGTTSIGSNFSDEKPKQGIAAAIEATGVQADINTVDHNSYQENFNSYIQQPDDVVSWFAGYRMRAFAKQGVVGDISDVWADSLDSVETEGFKTASTANDDKQYFVPFYFYAWGIHYRKSVWEENGYEIPTTWDDYLALLQKMQDDGLTPIAAANDGQWPQMGMFDMINMRVNGYDFHVSLMAGQEDWGSDQVKEVFTRWNELLPFYQPDPNGREWQAAATEVGDKKAGMMLIGNFFTDNFTDQEILDDIDFFAFPEINADHGQDAIEAPIDGFMMAASPKNEEAAKALLAGLGSKEAIEAYIAVTPSVVAANQDADTSGYNALQQKANDLVGQATYISQFLDRDTDPAFASEVVGPAFADFLSDPSTIDSILSTVEEQKGTYTFE